MGTYKKVSKGKKLSEEKMRRNVWKTLVGTQLSSSLDIRVLITHRSQRPRGAQRSSLLYRRANIFSINSRGMHVREGFKVGSSQNMPV